MTNGRFDELFGGPPRKPEAWLTQREMDLAASIQAVTEEVVLRLTRSIAAETGAKNLCLAGGVALNCVANGKVLRDGTFGDIWIQPAAGDAGGALGAALVAYHLYKAQPRKALNGSGDRMKGAYLGPSFSQAECESRLRASGARFTVLRGRCADCRVRTRARRRQGSRLVPGAHGVRTAGARRTLDPRRRTLADDAVGAQPQGQVPRVVPSVRTVGAARATSPTGSSSTTTAPTCCSSPTSSNVGARR